MFTWLKNIFSSPKLVLKKLVDALTLATPFLAAEIDKTDQFNAMNSSEKAMLIVGKMQEFLRKKFNLKTP